MKKLRSCILLAVAILVQSQGWSQVGKTEITRWQYGKNAAVSLTFDDGTINQFTVALPILNRLSLPATFFIITGQIPGSKYQGKFIGRPVDEIIAETATIHTNSENLFERASAIGYVGYERTLQFHTDAGALYDEEGDGKYNEVYAMIDEAYRQVREGKLKKKINTGDNRSGVTWEQIRTFASQGHEFASHTVTHPRLAILDEPNLLYEIQKSQEEILNHLGPAHTFSAEGPYGTENQRVVNYMGKVYPALRNRMPDPYLEELNRWNKNNPGESRRAYVQWQRGATTKTPLPLMKSWVDTVATNNNNWLVLVFHGVDGIGYEALSHELLEEYFQYMKQHEDKLWIATFGDVTKYYREHVASKAFGKETNGVIHVTLSHSLDKEMYNLPLTLKTYVDDLWKAVFVKQGAHSKLIKAKSDDEGSYVLYQATPNIGPVEISKAN
jgi:peptidoglycan/xylan/chitin deacetylase (PgdA/CDA1 family)